MKVTCLSDTHNVPPVLPGGDLLIHAGDFTNMGTVKEISRFNYWLEKQDYKTKVVVPGNHDWLFETNQSLAKSLLSSAIVLIDQWTLAGGLLLYGSPWQLEFCQWAFNLPEDKLAEKWANIPQNTDILITHSPPKGILDDSLGSVSLAEKLKALSLKVHIFGHIHEGYGTKILGKTLFVNAASGAPISFNL